MNAAVTKKPRPMMERLFRPFQNGKSANSDPMNRQGADLEGDLHDTGDKLNSTLDETTLGTLPPARPMRFTFPPGSKPLPPYTVRRGVGMGGFGEVYFAVSPAGKEVALKRIQRNLDIELRGVSQCLNLKHPNLVSLFDICNDPEGESWVVMEYVAGHNLREVLDQFPNGFAEDEARRWFAGIAAGVDHLHGAGLVHRDLKPGNVFDDLGIVKVGDYGLSKIISSSQRGGHTESVGTFHYMAPEIGRGQYGREIDIYALGILLYELLTGQVPFDGESCHEIIVKHMTATPDLSKVPSPYRETIRAALEKDPARRPSNISEMIAPLGLVLPGASPIMDSLPSKNQGTDQTNENWHEPVAKVTPIHPALLPAATVLVGSPAALPASSGDEPLMRAIRKSMGDFGSWWKSLEQSPRARFWIGAMIAFLLFVNTHWLLPALSIFAIVYVPYYIVRQMVLHSSEQPSYAKANQQALFAQQNQLVHAANKPVSRREWQNQVRQTLKGKRNLVRLAELNTSWIASSLTVLAMGIAAGIIGLRSGGVTSTDLAPYFWTVLVALVGTQGILVLGKLWERDEGEGLPRRLVLAGIGAGVGLFAFALMEFLMLPMQPYPSEFLENDLPQALYQNDGRMRAAGMMAHFAVLFGIIRWWRPVDPLRRKRLSLWSVAVVSVAAWIVHQVLPIPQPTGILLAGGMAIATQMSAPWINPRSIEPRKLAAVKNAAVKNMEAQA